MTYYDMVLRSACLEDLFKLFQVFSRVFGTFLWFSQLTFAVL